MYMKEKFEIFENDKNQQASDFYIDFKEKLEENTNFPSDYLFKFIVPTDEQTIAQVQGIFANDEKASFSSRDSKNGKYTSLTIKVHVKDADEVVNYYKQTSEIKGIVTL